MNHLTLISFLLGLCGCDGDAAMAPAPTDAPVDAPIEQPDLPPPQPVMGMTTEGPISGLRDPATGVAAYKKIPYAAPPIGELRFSLPQPPASHVEVLDGTVFGPACPQESTPLFNSSLGQSEDCLTLNLWAPEQTSSSEPLPVMVWLHGGAFVVGSSNWYMFEGTSLASRGVVVVTLNYRLGTLGFLAHDALATGEGEERTTGNWGLHDQITALRWVRDNAASFGGDPNNVTLFGESAGGMSVCALLGSPAAAGLFHRVISESGPCMSSVHMASAEQGAELAAAMVTRLGCVTAPDVAACLRALSVEEVMAGQVGTIYAFSPTERPGPVVDGVLLPVTPAQALRSGATADIPMLFGTNRDEGVLFAWGAGIDRPEELDSMLMQLVGPRFIGPVRARYAIDRYGGSAAEAAEAATTEILFLCPARRAARDQAAQGRRSWVYYFTEVGKLLDLIGLGATHGTELTFVFGDGMGLSADEARLGDRMKTWWTTFARTGVPGSVDDIDWPLYDASTEPYLELNAITATQEGWPNAAACDALETIFAGEL